MTGTIHLADGGTMTETLTRCDRPTAFGYDITDLRGALSPLVERIEGGWLLHGDADEVLAQRLLGSDKGDVALGPPAY